MKKNPPAFFKTGMEVLLTQYRRFLSGKTIALLSHSAAVDSTGKPSYIALSGCSRFKIKALFGPEHGFDGIQAAGADVKHSKSGPFGIPVFSLYGRSELSGIKELRNIDVIIFDIQDIAARPYTYVSTLRRTLESAENTGKTVIVADRPVPLPNTVDGPVLDENFSSFVGLAPAPMCYGMTPGETALWLKSRLNLKLDLKIAPMKNYRRTSQRQPGWPQWIPPSPAMSSWESAWCYTATVFSEAVPAVDVCRSGNLPFQVFGTAWMESETVCRWLSKRSLPGVSFFPYVFRNPRSDAIYEGVRLSVTDPCRFKPVLTGIEIIYCLQNIYGHRRLWQSPGLRPDFFDKLYGTDTVRMSLMKNLDPRKIAGQWRSDTDVFLKERKKYLLYKSCT